MRNPIQMKTENTLDEKEVERLSAEVVGSFDRYLDYYPSKNKKSKHGVMGPVARVLDLVRVKGASADHAIGVALRMHEMAPKAAGYVSSKAVDELDSGVRRLLELVRLLPPTRVPKALERIDYSLYYSRRRKGIFWMEQIKKEFADFAKGRAVSFEVGIYPRGKRVDAMSDEQVLVVEEFWKQRREPEAAVEDDEEEETK